jgi:RES domain
MIDGQYAITSDARGDWHRNVVSLRRSMDLFADLVSDPAHVHVLIEHEMTTKPTRGAVPILQRPFERAEFYDPIASALNWPFVHPAASRYSGGHFGVWYGARALETSIYETVYHFRRDTLASEIARLSAKPIVQERRVHLVRCDALLVDLRARCEKEPRLLADDYAYCQALGAQLRAASLPGVITHSARHAEGTVVGVFERSTLSQPRDVCFLTYTLHPDTQRVEIERVPGQVDWTVS